MSTIEELLARKRKAPPEEPRVGRTATDALVAALKPIAAITAMGTTG